MFAKVFSQIFNSSIANHYSTRHVFMDMLVLADPEGVVDMTHEAISRQTGVPYDIVCEAITELEQKDDKSRSPEEAGRRIVLIDSHRNWGWQIVNYEHYRSLQNEEARKQYFRDKQKEYRTRKKVKDRERQSKTVKDTLPKLTQEEEEEEGSLFHTESTKTPKVKGCSLARAANEQDVIEFARSIGLPKSDGEWFWNKCEGNGWANNGKPIKNWKATVRAWERANFLPSQKSTRDNGQKGGKGGQWVDDYEQHRRGYRSY